MALIVYVNKLDRDGAAFERTVHEIGSRLLGWPAVCQIPWWENGKGRFVGVGDVIALTGMRWGEGGDGKSVKVYTIQELEATDAGLAREIKKARVALIELLSEHDDLMVERYLECEENHLAIPPKEITESLRRCVLDGLGTVVPIFAGASFKNIGVQPLLDAVVDLLPDPRERPEPDITLGAISGSLNQLIDGKLDLAVEPIHDKKRAKRGIAVGTPRNMSLVAGLESCALAFKVVNDLRRGVLVYVRVYSGVIARNASLFNTNLQVSERAPRLLKMYASDAVEISSIPAGQIGVIVGLKHARTGDTLLSYPGVNPRAGPPSPLNLLQLRPIEIPPPVFFASVEPASLSEEKHLGECLSLLLREDPSLQISVDEDSGQTMLNGMGELHLEIARDRLVDDFRAKASMSRVEIGYRETLLEGAGPEHVVFDKEVAGKRGYAGCEASVMPLVDVDLVPETIAHTAAKDGNRITVNLRLPEGPESSTLTPHFPPHLPQSVVFSALVDGAAAALSRGPTHFYPMHSVGVSIKLDPLHDIHGTQTTPAALASATRLATRAALALAAGKPSGTALMEPVMTARISVDEASLGAVVHDLSAARGGHVLSLSTSSPGSSSEADGEVSRARIPPDRIYAPPDPFGPRGEASPTTSAANVPQQRSIVARVPLREMVGYLKHLRSLTGGRGTFVMNVDRFDRVGRQREKALLAELRGF
ncbi:MAG: Ribosome-releasing factor 2, mitochondrial [Thelocarpon impressellum]|nr:MAG: Ribosome-releasing factor 2, mitochondrial [Thelocarpon impressellum]